MFTGWRPVSDAAQKPGQKQMPPPEDTPEQIEDPGKGSTAITYELWVFAGSLSYSLRTMVQPTKIVIVIRGTLIFCFDVAHLSKLTMAVHSMPAVHARVSRLIHNSVSVSANASRIE